MNLDELIAIDVHTHAEISCREPEDDYANEIEEQKKKYFKSGTPPTIQETCDYYRERKIGLVMFTVDTEFEIGRRRIPNEEVLDAAKANSDIMIAFGSVDPHKGKMGLREVRKLIDAGVGGFKFHPTCQGFYPNDRMAYPYYEAMAEAKLPVIFHSGHSGMGSGLRGGGGMRLKYSNPMFLDDVAADFPDMTIIIAHPSWPWQDEALSVCLHRPVGLEPEVLPAAAHSLRQHAAENQDVVRHRLSVDHARTLDERLRRCRFPRRGQAAHHEAERDPRSGARSLSQSAIHKPGGWGDAGWSSI